MIFLSMFDSHFKIIFENRRTAPFARSFNARHVLVRLQEAEAKRGRWSQASIQARIQA